MSSSDSDSYDGPPRPTYESDGSSTATDEGLEENFHRRGKGGGGGSGRSRHNWRKHRAGRPVPKPLVCLECDEPVEHGSLHEHIHDEHHRLLCKERRAQTVVLSYHRPSNRLMSWDRRGGFTNAYMRSEEGELYVLSAKIEQRCLKVLVRSEGTARWQPQRGRTYDDEGRWRYGGHGPCSVAIQGTRGREWRYTGPARSLYTRDEEVWAEGDCLSVPLSKLKYKKEEMELPPGASSGPFAVRGGGPTHKMIDALRVPVTFWVGKGPYNEPPRGDPAAGGEPPADEPAAAGPA